jgi:hypothetical protein
VFAGGSHGDLQQLVVMGFGYGNETTLVNDPKVPTQGAGHRLHTMSAVRVSIWLVVGYPVLNNSECSIIVHQYASVMPPANLLCMHHFCNLPTCCIETHIKTLV